MNLKYKCKAGLIVFSFLFPFMFNLQGVRAEEEQKSVGNLFIEAFDKQDQQAMENLIKTRADEVPGEVQAIVGYCLSPDSGPQEQDFLFNIAGIMASIYGEQTGDKRLLSAVKMNFEELQKRRGATALSKEAVENVKKEFASLGEGTWIIRSFKMVPEKGLIIEVVIRETADGLTPKVDFKTSNKGKSVVEANFPNVKKGKITWSSLGVGLRTVFLGQN